MPNGTPLQDAVRINHYKMHFRFLSAKWNAATRCSYKNCCTGPFFSLNSPRNRGWYQARVHPFSSGNGKGDCAPSLGICKLCCKPSGSWLDQTLIELESFWPCSTWRTSKLLVVSFCRHGTMGRWEDEAKNAQYWIQYWMECMQDFVQFVGPH